jgi:replicative DNA helicase
MKSKRVLPTEFESTGDALGQTFTDILQPPPSVKMNDFKKFSYLTGGFRPKEFTILCGATGSGKTTLLANWSNALITENIPHFVASVETGRHDFVRRIISARVGEDWNTGDPVAIEKVKSMFGEQEIQRLKNAPMYLSLYENRFSVEQLISDIKFMIQEKGIKVAFIDNLNFFLEVTKSADQIIEMDRVIHELIIFCKTADVHIIMVMHPRKTDGARVESEFDVKGSSGAVQEAQNVLLWNRPGDDLIEAGKAEKGDRELKIAKMRRRGLAVGSRLVFESLNGVSYREGELICQR